MPGVHLGSQSGSFLITAAVVVGIILLRNSRPRRLRIERLWVRPVLFALILATTLASAPPPLTPLGILMPAAALAIGCAAGWQRGRFMHITVDPATHDLTSRASPVGIIFILVLVAARFWMRGAVAQGASFGGVPAATATDALIAFAAGMMATQTLEMWLRARRLLAEAIAAKTAGDPEAPALVR